MQSKRIIVRNILSQTPAKEGTLLEFKLKDKSPGNVVNLKTSEGAYEALLNKARKGIYDKNYPKVKMTHKEFSLIDNRIDRLIDLISFDYDEDRVEDAKIEAGYLQKLVLYSARFE